MIKDQRRGLILSSGSPLKWGVASRRFRSPCAKLCNLPGGLCVKLCFGTANACSGRFAGAEEYQECTTSVFYTGELTVSVTYHRQ